MSDKRLTPARRAFLEEAIIHGGKIIRPQHSSGWLAGSICARESLGIALCDLGLIERVKEPGGGNTKRAGMGYLYAVTDTARSLIAGRSPELDAALNVLLPPAC